MAKKTITVLTDDLDGSEAQETVSFALDGISYTIDLSDDNASTLRNALLPYIAVAERVGGGRAKPGVRGKATGRRPAAGGRASDIRAWATENGYAVSPRGRVPDEVRAAYEAAH